MKYHFFLVIVAFCLQYVVPLKAQDVKPLPPPSSSPKDTKLAGEPILTVVEKMPEFPGGQQALFDYLGNNINYPVLARENGIEGKVYIGFVVEKDGSITNVSVKRGIGGGCNEESVRVISAMPKWIPGKHKKKPVRVQFTLPIQYKLEDPKLPVDSLSTLKLPEVDAYPAYPGGETALFQDLANTIRYVKEAREQGIQGTVDVGFIVKADGSIADVKIINGVHPFLDNEVVRVVSAMPNWIPAKKNGVGVAYPYKLPIEFRMEAPRK
jgi:TonB family protein